VLTEKVYGEVVPMVRQLQRLLEDIGRNPALTLFFRNLWEHNDIGELFFLHREQLLYTIRSSSSPDVSLPFVFWTNTQETRSSTLEIFAQIENIRRQRAQKDMRIPELMGNMRDLYAYLAIQFVRSNRELKKLITDEEFDFEKMKQVLGDYSTIDLDKLDQIDIPPLLQSIIERVSLDYVSRFDPTNLLTISTQTTGILTSLFIEGRKHQKAFHSLLGLGQSQYMGIMNELYILNLVKNFQTVFWCEHCLDNPQILVTNSRVDPIRLRLDCLKCGKPMNVSAIYVIDNILRDCIFLKDGLLAIAMAWLFEDKKIQWEFSVHDGYENDFLCETEMGTTLYECKMHMIPRDKRSFEGQLKQDLVQLMKHVKALLKEGKAPTEIYLVYNYALEDYQEEIDTILQQPKYGGDLPECNLEVISYLVVPSSMEGPAY